MMENEKLIDGKERCLVVSGIIISSQNYDKLMRNNVGKN
jgi:hypothetical protein